jgi:putative hydrolase of the HAD superfamily
MLQEIAGHPVRGVLFDATGTLIELREPVGEVYSRIAKQHGVVLPAWRLGNAFERIMLCAPTRAFPNAKPEEIEALERGWWREVVRMTFQATDSSVLFADGDTFFTQLYRHYESSAAWRLVDEAEETLVELNSCGARIGIASNFDQRIKNIVQQLGIAKHFDSITIPAKCGVEKPDPGFFLSALSDLRLPANEVVYVGDHPDKDIAGARNAGLRTIDVNALSSLHQLPEILGLGSIAVTRPETNP